MTHPNVYTQSFHRWFTSKKRASVCHKQYERIDGEHTQLCFWQTSNLISVDRPAIQWLIKAEAGERSREKETKVISPDSIEHRWRKHTSSKLKLINLISFWLQRWLQMFLCLLSDTSSIYFAVWKCCRKSEPFSRFWPVGVGRFHKNCTVYD